MVKQKPRLAIITTHPIQYHAPLFRLLAMRGKVAIRVFYTWSQAQTTVYDPGFGKKRDWDIPLLDGYDYTFVPNKAWKPGSHHFRGIRNPALVKEILAWNPGAVWVFGWSFHSHLNCLRYFKGRIPVFFRGDSTLLDEAKGLKTILRHHFLRWVYRHVDLAFYVGQNNRDYFLKHGLKDHQLRLAFHAIDNERFSQPELEQKAREWRRQQGFQPTDFIVLFAGKLEQKKAPFFLLKLAGLIKDGSVKFLLVGNGALEEQLKKEAQSYSNVSFLEFQNQSVIPLVYHAADCFILPSTGPGETWGLAANEAMASGLPVLLSTKAGGAIDLVDGNGLVFGPQEMEKVARYINNLSADSNLHRQCRLLSQERIKRFSLERIAEAVEKELIQTECWSSYKRNT
jgi:glycosyltransferase involved in cell wall biosynthesis